MILFSVSLASYGLCWFASCCVLPHRRVFAYEVNVLKETSLKRNLLTNLEDRLLSIMSSEPYVILVSPRSWGCGWEAH
jgi:hypothetical protein